MFRAFARLGTHYRDSQRRERKQPREDLRLDRAMGGRAEETSAWGRPTSHFGVLVKAKSNLCKSNAAQLDADRKRVAAAPLFIKINHTLTICTYIFVYVSFLPYLLRHILEVISVMHVVMGIVIGYTSLMWRKVRAVMCVYFNVWKPPWAGLWGISGWHGSKLPDHRQVARADATRKWEERWHANPRTSLTASPAPAHPTENCSSSYYLIDREFIRIHWQTKRMR